VTGCATNCSAFLPNWHCCITVCSPTGTAVPQFVHQLALLYHSLFTNWHCCITVCSSTGTAVSQFVHQLALLYHSLFTNWHCCITVCSPTGTALAQFVHQLTHNLIVLRTILKFHIKIYIKTAATCFGVITIIRERTIQSY
jgi:hypothetical protein